MSFEALYEKSLKMAKRNMEFNSSSNKTTLEKDALKQRVTSMKNEVASLKEERMIIRLKEKLVRQKEKYTRLLKEKENLLKSVDKLLNAPHLARSQKRDSTLK